MEDRIIVALDGMDKFLSLDLARKLTGISGLWGFKVNSLLRREGYNLINELKQYGRVFADLKLHDIPNTVKNDIEGLKKFKPDFVTIHASGGLDMMQAAVETAENKISVLAVTILTSLNEKSCGFIYNSSVMDKVFKFARLAYDSGIRHIVCSPHEVDFLKKHHATVATMDLIVPGIRPSWYLVENLPDDQKRYMTAKDAINAGASYIVIGRPITKAKDPVEAIQKTMKEILDG